MKLEKQVCSLELAKQLKELGVTQESLWVWEFADGVPSNLNAAASSGSNVYAYSAAELGGMLPCEIDDDWLRCIKSRQDGNAIWKIRYAPVGGESEYSHQENAETEADARAKMLIYLLENKITQPAA